MGKFETTVGVIGSPFVFLDAGLEALSYHLGDYVNDLSNRVGFPDVMASGEFALVAV